MGFQTLVYKELRLMRVWIILSFLVIFSVGFIEFLYQQFHVTETWQRYSMHNIEINRWHSYAQVSMFTGVLIAVAWCSIVLGIIAGFYQFWLPRFLGTWHFELHRAITLRTVLLAKMTATFLVLFLGVVLPWIIVWPIIIKASIAPPDYLFSSGLWFVTNGIVLFLTVSLCALSNAKWYSAINFFVPMTFALMALCYNFMEKSEAPYLLMFVLMIALALRLHRSMYRYNF